MASTGPKYVERQENHSEMASGPVLYSKWGKSVSNCFSVWRFRSHMGRNTLKYVRDSRMECCQEGSNNLHFNELWKGLASPEGVNCRLQVAGARCRLQMQVQVAGCRLQVAGAGAGCRLQLQVAGCRLQVAGCRLQVAGAGCRLQVAGCRCRLQVAGCGLRVVGSG